MKKTKKDKSGLVAILIGLLSIAMLVGTFYIAKDSYSYLKTAIEVKGTVVELVRSESSSDSSYTYAPVVAFRAGEQEIKFQSNASSNPPSYSVGEEITVLYKPSNPNKAKIKGFFSLWGGALILGILGGVLFLLSVPWIILLKIKGIKNNSLKAKGRKISVKVSEIKNLSKYDGIYAYQVFAEWINPSTSKTQILKSDRIFSIDPTEHIGDNLITVYIDKNNPEKYFMDLSFIED